MSEVASVFAVEAIKDASKELCESKNNIFEACNDGLNQAKELLELTQTEKDTSYTLLNVAKNVEFVKHSIVIGLEAELAEATMELVAASPNPIAMVAIGARIADIEAKLVSARQEYAEAVQHREAMERRYELAIKAVNIAKDRYDNLQMNFETHKREIESLVDTGYMRLNNAYNDLSEYLLRISPPVREYVNKWFTEKPQENTVIRPDSIKEKLDVNENVIDTILVHLYATDIAFRGNVDNYCEEMKFGNKDGVELKIKKYMVGRLCEEIVIRTFKPISKKIDTQKRESLPDGRYTKVDMVVYGLTHPIILGRGEGMGARDGGSFAVEVKSGQASYLYQQINHMELQAYGHQGYDASCVICTRDIHDLSAEKENELRTKLREAGSPIIGMLPRKEELDQRCINFVKGKVNHV